MASPDIVWVRQPSAHGIAWLRRAFAMFGKHRAPWIVMFTTYFLILAAVGLVPLVGAVASFIMRPILAVGMLAAAWGQERGEVPSPRQILHGFRSNVWALALVGVFFFVGVAVAVQVAMLADGGKLQELASTGSAISEEQVKAILADRSTQFAMLLAVLLTLPVLLAVWWAPAIIVFQDAGAGKALVTSLRASLANWRALALYALTLVFYWLALPMMGVTLLAMVLPGGMLQILFWVLFVYFMILATIQHISDYVSYRDVFHPEEALTPTPAEASAP